MTDRIRRHLTFANCVSVLALFVALGGTSYAVATGSIGSSALRNNSVRSIDLKNNDVRGKDIRNGTIVSGDVRDGGLTAGDFAPGQLPAGATGPRGPAGQDGSSDTPPQILSKLQSVDGSGSGLDADTVDGLSSNAFVPLATADAALPAVPMRFYSYFMTTTGTTRFNFGQMALEAAGSAGQFRICGDIGSAALFNYVVYVNGVRSAGTVAGNGCTAPFDAGAGGDFQVSMRRSIVFGVHSGDGTTNENYNVYGFGQL